MQYRFVYPAQFLTGIGSELVTQSYAHVFVGSERFRLTSAAVQGPHAQGRQRLVVAVSRRRHRQPAQVVEGIAEPAQQDQALEPLQPECPSALLQPLPLLLRERSRQPGQGFPPEQPDGCGELVCGGGQVARRDDAKGLVAPFVQIRRIEPDLLDDEAVPALATADHRLRGRGGFRIEHPAQRVDVSGQHLVAACGRLLAPHRVEQSLMTHHGPLAQQQSGQHGLPLDRPQLYGRPASPCP